VKPNGEHFAIRFNATTVPIETYIDKGIELYLIKFPGRRHIFITKLVHGNTLVESWTSVPEGEQELATEIGKILDQRNNRPKQTALF
jgi:hypothetical protein